MSFDDQPVGQHKKLDIPELPSDIFSNESPALSNNKGPLAERLKSKNMKCRFEAFTELAKLFSEATNSDPIFAEHYPFFQKYVADSHSGSQEKALEALIILIDKKPPPVDKCLIELLNVIIEKAYTSTKTSTKTKAANCLFAIAALENSQTTVLETTQNYIIAKDSPPKVIVGAIQTLSQLLNEFGNLVFPVDKVLANVASQASSSLNPSIRTESMNYFKEAYRWDSNATLKAMKSLKVAQQKELKKQFSEKTDNEPPAPKRKIKGNILDMKVMPVKKEVKDPYATAKEVNVLKNFGEHWCNEMRKLKKWQEKRDKLDDLIKTISVDKIMNENFTDLGKLLKELLNDKNVVVVNLAVKAIGILAKGLRVNFTSYSRYIFTYVLHKVKDKKTTTEAQKCLANLVLSIKIEDIICEITKGLNDKSPVIKSKVCVWLQCYIDNYFLKYRLKRQPGINETSTKTIVDSCTAIIVKLTDDAASEVRDSALSCLGALQASTKDENIEKLLKDMNQQKLEKIAAAAESFKAKNSEPLAEDMKMEEKNEEQPDKNEPNSEIKMEEEIKKTDNKFKCNTGEMPIKFNKLYPTETAQNIEKHPELVQVLKLDTKDKSNFAKREEKENCIPDNISVYDEKKKGLSLKPQPYQVNIQREPTKAPKQKATPMPKQGMIFRLSKGIKKIITKLTPTKFLNIFNLQPDENEQ